MGYAPVRLRCRCCDNRALVSRPAAAALVRCAAVGRRAGEGTLELSYYDVSGRRLIRAGATLSRRLQKGKGIWRLELPRLDGSQAELEQPGGPTSPPSRIARSLVGLLRGSEAEPVVRLRLPDGPESETAEVLEVSTQRNDFPSGTVACMLASSR